MENKSAHSSIWNPVATAPTSVELELCIYDSGEYHALAFPCRRNGVGWSDVRLNKMVADQAHPLAAMAARAHLTKAA